MAMSELKQKLLLYELSRLGFRDAAYDPDTDLVTLEPDKDRGPHVNGAGEIIYPPEYSEFAADTLWPLVTGVAEVVAAWERSTPVPVQDVAHFRVLAEYNNVVLAARDDTNSQRGLHFVTWSYDLGRTGVSHGHYTENYNTAKEDFAVRSGLVSAAKLLTMEQATPSPKTLSDKLRAAGERAKTQDTQNQNETSRHREER